METDFSETLLLPALNRKFHKSQFCRMKCGLFKWIFTSFPPPAIAEPPLCAASLASSLPWMRRSRCLPPPTVQRRRPSRCFARSKESTRNKYLHNARQTPKISPFLSFQSPQYRLKSGFEVKLHIRSVVRPLPFCLLRLIFGFDTKTNAFSSSAVSAYRPRR